MPTRSSRSASSRAMRTAPAGRWRRIWRRWRGGCGSTRRRRRTRTSPACFLNWAWPPARKDRPGEPLVRLLLYNPNTDSDLTARLASRLRPKLGAGETLKAVTAAEGPDFIGSAAAVAAVRATLGVALAAPAEACDAVLLGCRRARRRSNSPAHRPPDRLALRCHLRAGPVAARANRHRGDHRLLGPDGCGERHGSGVRRCRSYRCPRKPARRLPRGSS